MEMPPEGKPGVGTLLSAGQDALKEGLVQLQATAEVLQSLQQRLDGLSKASKACPVREALPSRGTSETTTPPSSDSPAGRTDAPDAAGDGAPAPREAGAGASDTLPGWRPTAHSGSEASAPADPARGMPAVREAGAGASETLQDRRTAQASVAADLAAEYRQELDVLHRSWDVKVQAALEQCLGPCEASGATAEEARRHLHERFLRLHREHEACVTELHLKQELRLRQLLPRPTTIHRSNSTNSRLTRLVSQASLTLQNMVQQPSSSSVKSVRISSISCVSDLATDAPRERHDSSMRPMPSGARSSTCTGGWLQCTRDGLLENASTVLTVLNVIWMAVEVDVFAVLFSLEIAARLCVQRCSFFEPGRRFWNLFNALIVLADLYDLFTRMYSPDFLRSLRVLRSVRALRVMGAVRFVPGLRLMVASIVCSLSAVVWALVFLLLMTFVGALCLLQSLTVILVEGNAGGKPQDPLIQTYYGSMGSTMLNLLLGVTGGIDWQVMMQPLWPIASWCAYILMLLMIFLIVGVLNVVTSVFVESTHRIYEVDSDLAVSEQYHRDMNICKALRAFLTEAGDEGSSCLTKDNFDAMLEAPRCQAMLRTLDLDVWSVRGVFRMLAGAERSVEIEDLVYGLTRLKGNAKAIDMAMLMYEGKRSQARMAAAIVQIEGMLRDLRADLKGPKGSAVRHEPLMTTDSRSLIL